MNGSQGPAVLVLDDEPSILDLILLALVPGEWGLGRAEAQAPCRVTASKGPFAGTTFLVARSAEQAIALTEALHAEGGRLSGGFFDLHLSEGGLQGTDAMRVLRVMQPGLLCTVITGLQGEGERVAALFAPDHLDEWDFVAKPFTRGEMVQRCRQMSAAAARRAREAANREEIERLNRELQAWARSLETRVEERTAELGLAMEALRGKNEELECVLGALHETQAELVQHEKMATIGQLATGVARELSRPLAYAQQALAGVAGSVERLGEFAACIESSARSRPESSPEAVAVRDQFATTCGAWRPQAAHDEAQELVQNAAEGLLRASGIVRDLASFATVASHAPGPTDVRRTLVAAVDLVRGALQCGEALEVDVAELPEVEGSAAELQHAWLALLRNASEATAGRGSAARVRVAARVEGGEVVVEMEDNGEGIPDDVKPRIFEPFFTTRGRKSGLGLSVVHGVVERHGGRIEVRDASGGGTVVTVALPALPVLRVAAV